MEGFSEWKMLIVGVTAQLGRYVGSTPLERKNKKGPFLYVITFNPQHNSRK